MICNRIINKLNNTLTLFCSNMLCVINDYPIKVKILIMKVIILFTLAYNHVFRLFQINALIGQLYLYL